MLNGEAEKGKSRGGEIIGQYYLTFDNCSFGKPLNSQLLILK